jgi:endonuclease III
MDKELQQVYKVLSEHYPSGLSPEAKAGETLYQSLITVMLSAQSKDERTVKAANQLFAVAKTPNEMLELGVSEIAKLIKPAGLYNVKAKNIALMTQQLLERFSGQVPKLREKLMTLPGVGRKSADIILRFEYGKNAIPVDTHVYRLTSRLGLHSFASADPVAEYLEKETPEEYKGEAHMWLLLHGKRVCRAIRPACGSCILKDLCVYPNKRLDILE